MLALDPEGKVKRECGEQNIFGLQAWKGNNSGRGGVLLP
jgi:hypothetical protein